MTSNPPYILTVLVHRLEQMQAEVKCLKVAVQLASYLHQLTYTSRAIELIELLARDDPKRAMDTAQLEDLHPAERKKVRRLITQLHKTFKASVPKAL